MRTEPIRVDNAILDAVKSRLLNLSIGLDNVGTGAVAPAGSSVTTGAGQFAASLGDDVQKLVDSWRLFSFTPRRRIEERSRARQQVRSPRLP
jgi:hypothetical protein